MAPPHSLLSALQEGASVVTGNERAARLLQQAFDQSQHAAGRASWQPAQVLSWNAWTGSLWRQLLLSGHATELLLNRAQEHDLWLCALRADTSLQTLRSLDSLASLASEALRLTCAFHAEEELHRGPAGSDARSFRRWAVEFDRLCRSTESLPQARLESRLISALHAGHLALPATVHLLGFDSFTPIQECLLATSRELGTSFVEEVPATTTAQARALYAKDPNDELSAAARWARNLLEENPLARIAIIAPALSERRWEIEHTFHRVLAFPPHHARHHAPPQFEFSLGKPLSQAPPISTALDLLRWTAAPLPRENVTALLLSPHFAPRSAELSTRATFDANLFRRLPRLTPEWTLEELHELLSGRRAAKYILPALRARLRDMRLLQQKHFASPSHKTPDLWAELFREYLTAAGWNSPEQETTLDVQLRRKGDSALDQLSTLSFRGERISLSQALRSLERIVQETTFAPESAQASVQIMEPLEAAGSTFDAIWSLGCTDLAWPPVVGTNPLLPRSLQQRLGLPGADKERDLAFAARVTSRLSTSTPNAIFSYVREGAEGPQRPSALLRHLIASEQSTEAFLPPEPARAPVALETVLDSEPIPPPGPHVQGGARVLELQAACGFRAFAELRLASTEPRSASLGLDAGERGSLVHKALELFWKHARSQRALKTMTTEERESLLQESIEHALENGRRTAATSWEIAYLDSQRDRLTSLLRRWLEVELERSPFEIVEHEKNLRATCGPLLLDVRLDRLDLVADTLLLIDYKTGQANSAQWYGDRPDAPQLPLYAIASELESLAGLAFAHVRAGKEARLTGIASAPALLDKRVLLSPEEFHAQMNSWHAILAELADAFYRGEASTSPKQFPATCERCSQRLLCRLDPLALEEDEQPFHETIYD